MLIGKMPFASQSLTSVHITYNKYLNISRILHCSQVTFI